MLNEGLRAITPAFGAVLAEACAICFSDQGHPMGVELKVQGSFDKRYRVYWPKVTEQMLNCYNDHEVTTEYAAVGIAVLLIRDLTGYTVIRRSAKSTGIDYWLGIETDRTDDFLAEKARLEVSGILKGNPSGLFIVLPAMGVLTHFGIGPWAYGSGDVAKVETAQLFACT